MKSGDERWCHIIHKRWPFQTTGLSRRLRHVTQWLANERIHKRAKTTSKTLDVFSCFENLLLRLKLYHLKNNHLMRMLFAMSTKFFLVLILRYSSCWRYIVRFDCSISFWTPLIPSPFTSSKLFNSNYFSQHSFRGESSSSATILGKIWGYPLKNN